MQFKLNIFLACTATVVCNNSFPVNCRTKDYALLFFTNMHTLYALNVYMYVCVSFFLCVSLCVYLFLRVWLCMPLNFYHNNHNM